MDSLAALVAEAERRFSPVACSCVGTTPDAMCSTCIAAKLAAALRPFAAPVGVEAFEGLRLPHGDACDFEVPINQKPCTCGTAAHNALLDQCIAAHVVALAEVAELRRERDALRRAWPTDPRYVNATPDAEYPERILGAYIDESTASGNMGGEVLAKLMNEAQAERNAILRGAIVALSAHRARVGGGK